MWDWLSSFWYYPEAPEVVAPPRPPPDVLPAPRPHTTGNWGSLLEELVAKLPPRIE
jgi:hypothetical protein